MNAPSTAAAGFWDRNAARYSRRPVSDEEAYRLTLERTAHHLLPDARVLEIGCGTGTTALKLAQHAGSIRATDVSKEMIAIAREKARAQGADNVEFSVGTVEEEALTSDGDLDGSSTGEDRSFDAVLAFNLIHLLVDVPGALRRVNELLKPGGSFISKTPCLAEGGIWIRGVVAVMRLFGRAPFVHFLSRDSLQSEIVAAGFEVIETGFYPKKSHSWFVVARKRGQNMSQKIEPEN